MTAVIVRPQKSGSTKNRVHLIAATHLLGVALQSWQRDDENQRSENKDRTENVKPSLHGVRIVA
jgi:hypothetical protein